MTLALEDILTDSVESFIIVKLIIIGKRTFWIY